MERSYNGKLTFDFEKKGSTILSFGEIIQAFSVGDCINFG